MIKTDREHSNEVEGLKKTIGNLETENKKLKSELEEKNSKIVELEHSANEIHSETMTSSPAETWSISFTKSYTGPVSVDSRRCAAI